MTKQVEELVAAINGTGLPNAEPIRSASSLPNYQKTMIPQHTPGPWNADLASPYPSIYESAEPFRLICDFQEARMKFFQFQLDQQQNAIIGRTGGKQALGK